MSTSSARTDSDPVHHHPPDRHPPGRSRQRSAAKLAGALALAVAGLVTLVAGIVIGNGARKRIDRWLHGY
jgi:hypothetical protein